MPFAPIVLEEMMLEIFDITQEKLLTISEPIKYMTISLPVKEKYHDIIPAVVHVDGTARPQAINESTDKIYYHVLKKYYHETNIPALVNTSFNLHEEPIVNTPQDALRALSLNAIDILIMDNYVVYK